MPTIGNKAINAIPTIGAVGADVVSKPPKISWLICVKLGLMF